MSNTSRLGIKLKELRSHKKLTQKELAAAIGTGQTTIANYEAGVRFPDEQNLIKLSDYFNISIDSLMGRSADRAKNLNRGQQDFQYIPSGLSSKVDEYMESSLKSSGRGTEMILSLLDSGYTEEQITLDLLEASLRRAGDLWAGGEYNEAMEHQLSMTVLQSLFAMKSELGTPPVNRGKAVALTAAGERHTIGLRMICRFLEMDGWECLYLGSSVPPASLRDFIEANRAKLLLISLTLNEHADSACSLVEAVKKLDQPPAVIVGGQGTVRNADPLKKAGADFLSTSASETIAWTRFFSSAVEV